MVKGPPAGEGIRRRWWLGMLGVVIALAGCGGTSPPASSASIPVAAEAKVSAAPPASAPNSAKPAASAARVAAEVYFTAGGKLVAESGQVSAESPAKGATELLLQGPKNTQHFSEIPKGTRLLELTIKDGTATASFDHAFFAPGGAASTELRLAQVVYTLTQFPTVKMVQFQQEGQPPPVMGEGLSASRPMSRGNFSRLA